MNGKTDHLNIGFMDTTLVPSPCGNWMLGSLHHRQEKEREKGREGQGKLSVAWTAGAQSVKSCCQTFLLKSLVLFSSQFQR